MSDLGMIYLDTHVPVWLYASGGKKISPAARAAIDEAKDLRISPMVLLEIDFLHEIKRIRVSSNEIFTYLHHHLGLNVCDRLFGDVVANATTQDWTRDPFDRLIVAHAALGKDQLISKDSMILTHYSETIW
jgi:PIN domain nuclease of toxin-antitoxin system